MFRMKRRVAIVLLGQDAVNLRSPPKEKSAPPALEQWANGMLIGGMVRECHDRPFADLCSTLRATAGNEEDGNTEQVRQG
jgi:hypothetical protein